MPSEHKKNPGLGPMIESFDTNYVSPASYLFESAGILGLGKNYMKKGPAHPDRKIFDTYPIYLKHTLMHEDEQMKKIRQLEVPQRFFIYDKYREQGNKQMNKNDYEQAILYYERAYSCFKWLELKEEEEDEK